jgi:hypothetical protein
MNQRVSDLAIPKLLSARQLNMTFRVVATVFVCVTLLTRQSHGQAPNSGVVEKSRSIFAVTNLSSLAATNDSRLESALAELTKPSKNLSFKSVILATTHHRVLNFDTNNAVHLELQHKITQAAASASQRMLKEGIAAARANEAGNHLEPFVRQALNEAGLDARVPVNTAGRAQATGYPDIEITAPTPCYLELKTYNSTTMNTTQRSFYYSPSAQPKVTRDALHLLLAYQLERQTRDGKTIFLPVNWKLLTLENMEVDLKFEFNQSNRGMYGNGKNLLQESETK